MPPDPSITYWFLPHLVERLTQVALVASFVALGVVVAGGVVRLLMSARMRRGARHLRGRMYRGQVRAFAQAVAAGDLPAAELAASVVLHQRPLRARAKHRGPLSWDELALREGPLAVSAAALATPGHRVVPCPVVDSRDPCHTHLIVAGRLLPSILLRFRWTGPLEARFTAESVGAGISGQLRLRRVTAPMPREEVELWVHAEGIGGCRSRLAMWTLRRATRERLQQWAAKPPGDDPCDGTSGVRTDDAAG